MSLNGGTAQCEYIFTWLHQAIVTSPSGLPEMTMQPACHEYRVCCLQRVEVSMLDLYWKKNELKLEAGNTQSARVERVSSSSFPKLKVKYSHFRTNIILKILRCSHYCKDRFLLLLVSSLADVDFGKWKMNTVKKNITFSKRPSVSNAIGR